MSAEHKRKVGRPAKVVHIVPEGYKEQSFEIPEYIKAMHDRGGKEREIIKLAEAIKASEKGRGIVLTLVEFDKRFGPYAAIKPMLAYIRSRLKAHGVAIPRVVFDNDRIYCWMNDIT